MNTEQAKMFEYYYSLGSSRSMKKVASNFGCSYRTVLRCSKSCGWVDLVGERDRGVIAAIKEAGDEDAVVSVLETQRMTSEFMREGLRLFQQGEIKIKSFSDMERVVKMHLEATKLENQTDASSVDNVASLVDALKVGFAALPDENPGMVEDEEEQKWH